MSEPLTEENPERFTVKPVRHLDLWDMFMTQKKLFWWDTDVVFTPKDRDDWEHLNSAERNFVENILAFFASADGIVMENLGMRFLSEIQLPEARMALTVQMAIEMVHSLVYQNLLEFYIKDPQRRESLLKANLTTPAVKAKADWALHWVNSAQSLGERLIAFVCVEGIFFSGAFCVIYWLAHRRILPALTFSNNLIARDEKMHVETGILLYKQYIRNKLSVEKVHAIFRDAIRVEEIFIEETLYYDLENMNKRLLKQYVHYHANRLCKKLGYPSLFDEAPVQPFTFMAENTFERKENFFETRVSNYQNQAVLHDADINFESDF